MRLVRRHILDLVPLATGTLLLIGAVVFQLRLRPPVVRQLAESPQAFAEGFAALNSWAQMILFPLGFLTTIATFVVLLRQGAASARGRLRIVAVTLLILSALITMTAIHPLEETIRASLETQSVDAISALLQRWSMLQWLNLGLVAAVGVTLVVAHRLPAPVAHSVGGVITHRHRNLLFLLGAATLFEGYDRFIVSLALPYIGHDLGASAAELGYALSLIRVGALLSILLGRVADRYGRRRLLLVTVLAYTLATAATGASRGLTAFVVFQLVATVFLVAELALAQVVIAEEFPAEARGRGQGILGAFGALGAGVAAILFPLLQQTALGWRGLYFVGIAPLLLVTYLRRALPETQRWQRLRADVRRAQPGLLEVLRPGLRARFIVLMVVAGSATLIGGSAFGFAAYRATNVFGWTPAQVSAAILTGGGLGFVGWFAFGRLVDALGRRIVGVVSLLGAAGAVLAYFQTSWLLSSFAVMVFLEAGTSIALNSLGTELFPTALRATAKAWITNANICGGMLGLAVVGAASERLGGADNVIALMTIVPLAAAPLLLLLPESRGRELEALEAD
jgi:putative MFS transporter